jgi:hypothetical protein
MKSNKKYAVIGISVAAGVLAVVFLLINIFNYLYWPKGRFTPDENLSRKSVSSHILEITDNKLYYSYAGNSPIRHGVFEITPNGSSLKYWDGFSIKSWTAPNLDAFKDNLLINRGMFYIDDISHLNLDTGNIETFSKPKGAEKNGYFNYVVSKDKIYLPSTDKIYVSYDGTNTKVAFDNGSDIIANGDIDDPETIHTQLYKIDGDTLIYISKDKRIKEYDLINKKYILSKKIKNKKFFKKELINLELFKCGEKVIVVDYSNNAIIYDATDNCKTIYESDEEYPSLANFGNLLFIGADNSFYDTVTGSLTALDINTGKAKTIVKNKSITDVFVFGDKWVYYCDEKDNLYRVTHDGKIIEKVFG